MEFKQIKELIALLGKTDITSLHFKDKDGEIKLERKENLEAHRSSLPSHFSTDFHHKFPSHSIPLHRETSSLETHNLLEKKPDGKYILSPLVGTIYLSPSPEDPPFVKKGDRVDENTIVCIVEAMKVMNEVKAGVSGNIHEILVQNGDPVEFGAKLFIIS